MEETTPLFSLSIDPATKSHLSETAKWARFLAVAGLIFLILLIFFGLYSTLVISRYEDVFNGYTGRRGYFESIGVGVAILYVVIAVVAFFPLLFMLRFAGQMRNALSANDQALLNSSFQNLKVYFRYLGIVTIIFLVLTVLSMLLGILGNAV